MYATCQCLIYYKCSDRSTVINGLGCIEGISICSQIVFFLISFKISSEKYTL